jgi:hypothetical protein
MKAPCVAEDSVGPSYATPRSLPSSIRCIASRYPVVIAFVDDVQRVSNATEPSRLRRDLP